MLFRIMKQEWRNLRADRTLWAVAALLSLTVGYGAYNGAAFVRFQQRTLRAAAEEERARLGKMKAAVGLPQAERSTPESAFRDPRNPSAVGRTLGLRYAAMPPASTAALSIGQSDLYPYYFKVSTASKQSFVHNDEIENPMHLLSGRFDLSFVIIYLYPLIIFALSYNLISAEKETGTLALTLSQPVLLRSLVAGKVALRAAFVVLLALLIAVGGMLLGGADLASPGTLVRLAFWMALVITYGSFWFSLAVAVNAWGGSSATNAMTLAGLWLGFVLVIPALLNVGIKILHPAPSRVELIQAMRDASTEASAGGSKLLAQYLEDHPELSGGPTDEFGVVAIAAQEHVERAIQPVLERFDGQLERQRALVNRYRFLSPAIVAQSSLNDVAGTGAFRYQYFLAQVDRYHEEWSAFFNSRTIRRQRLVPDDFDRLPRFEFSEEPLGAVTARVLAGLLGLLVPGFAITAVALHWLRRYPVVG